MIIIMIINYFKQPTGNSCGPTALKMAHSTLFGAGPSILEICDFCNTDWIVGTPPDRMELGLNALKMLYIIHKEEEDPFKSLQISIHNESIPVLRTLTNGVPHWIIVNGYDSETEIYQIQDPWLGQIHYSKEKLNDIWVVRDYFYFEIYKQ